MFNVSKKNAEVVFNSRSVHCPPPHTAAQAWGLTGRPGMLQELGEAEGAAVLPFIWLQMKITLKVLWETDGMSKIFSQFVVI